ncbi:hypothetical protein D0Y65_006827 [Glycine soja]|uniref:ATP-dependent DNA helicase n=1 Tax=Glycine soja TaxID=3848 RepID=A0A445LB20_GLYSO|nr:hypothetical protein D0Y65_006827 [Glycine soja]
MARIPDKIQDINRSKETLKLAVRITDLGFLGTPDKFEQAEMIIVDSHVSLLSCVLFGGGGVFDPLFSMLTISYMLCHDLGDEIHAVYIIGVVDEVVFRQVSSKSTRVVFKLKDLRLTKLGIEVHSVMTPRGKGSSQLSDSLEDINSDSTQDSIAFVGDEHCHITVNDPTIITQGYFELGDQLMQCKHYNANMCYNERISQHKNSSSPSFNLCCGDGKVELPLLQNPPKHLQHLLLDHNAADNGYRTGMLHRATSTGKKRKRNHLTMREWFAFRLQCRSNEAQTLLHSRKLFQQFVVEGYTMVESERLSFIRNNQKKLRVDKFCNLQQSLDASTTKGLHKVHDENDATYHVATHRDEIKEYLDYRKPAVERLHFHLPRQHIVLYQDHDDIKDVLSKPSISNSKFISWMNTNRSFLMQSYPARALDRRLQVDWARDAREDPRVLMSLRWCLQSSFFHLHSTAINLQEAKDSIDEEDPRPTSSTWSYITFLKEEILLMLNLLLSPTSSQDIRIVANVQYPTYREACFAMGFLQDGREFVEAIKEAKDWGTTHYLRKLFVLMLLTSTMNKPEEVWKQTWHWLANDIEYHLRKTTANTDLQASIYKQIIQAVNKDEGGMFFLYGYRGTGKTFIWKTLASSLRANNKIVIMVASSGIASLLLPRGRTAHSKFKIPVPIFEDSTSLDKTLRDIIKGKSSSNQIFGGKLIVLGGDFRQILPVIPRGSRSDIVHATINSSYLWNYCQTPTRRSSEEFSPVHLSFGNRLSYNQVLPLSALPYVDASAQHMTILTDHGHPLQWNVTVNNPGIGQQCIAHPWYEFLANNDFSPGDEISFYFRTYHKVWELSIRKQQQWDDTDSD